MSITTKLLALTIAVVSVDCATLLPTLATAASGCIYEGKWYPEGNIRADPCRPCHCRQGRLACAVVDCFFTQCVDPVRDPDHCCPVCPNGPNCRAPNGQVISAGQDLQIDASTTCRCDPRGGLGFMSMNQAVCISKAEPVTAVVVP